jgi:small-conductance mechanosensitive channel/CRP-like cAMP-binding protein
MTLFLAAALVAAVNVVALLFFRNRVIKRRMLFALAGVAALVAFQLAVRFGVFPASSSTGVVEKLLFALAAINTVVALLFNPWFSDRVRDRAPAVVQDAIVVSLFLLVGLVAYQEDAAKLLATSAIAAAVLGLALQETLGNAFAGLAIQTEKPFRVGHWVTVAGYEGRVTEVTWRATKIRTKNGNLVTLPNNVVAREPISNFTEPTAPTRLVVEVGASYGTPPNVVREALLAALRRTPRVLAAPAADVLLHEFAASAITYRVRFWLDDYELEEETREAARTAIYYEFARRNIEIPWPIQIEYSREEIVEPAEAKLARFEQVLTRVPVLAALFVEGRRALAADAVEQTYADGEVIVREGDGGDSMFVVCSGEVRITVANGHEVARTKEGGYFGEMSLLTGEPRSATVSAAGDCTVLEIKAMAFREYVTTHPEIIDHLAAAAAGRRRELDQSRAAAAVASPEARRSLADRMRRFFGLE